MPNSTAANERFTSCNQSLSLQRSANLIPQVAAFEVAHGTMNSRALLGRRAK